MRWELLWSALSVLTLDWGLREVNKLFEVDSGWCRMNTCYYRAQPPIDVNFPVEISGLTENCLRRQSQVNITKTTSKFNKKSVTNITWRKYLWRIFFSESKETGDRRQETGEKTRKNFFYLLDSDYWLLTTIC